MAKHQVELPADMPKTMRYNLPRDDVGRPVPFFVEYVDGKPDFRIMNPTNMVRCIQDRLCWVCGRKMTRGAGTFVVGPMCVINCTSAEPPSHYACGEWSTKACPFLNTPGKVRRDYKGPHEVQEAPGVMIARNPGVTALVTCEQWRIFTPPGGGMLWHFTPRQIEWVCQGRAATPEEVWASVETGIDALIEAADAQDADEGGHDSRRMLSVIVGGQMTKWFPERPDDVDTPRIAAALRAV